MKTSLVMLGTGKLFWVLFLIPHLGIWTIDGKKLCIAQIRVKRDSMHNVIAGQPFHLECPVKYCANKPNVTWCKLEGEMCPTFRGRQQVKDVSEKEKIIVHSLHFEPAQASDNGSYRCFANVSSGLIESYSITIYVTEQTESNSEYPLITVTNISDTTNASDPHSRNKMQDKHLIFYSLLPLGGLPLLITCFFLFCCLRRRQGEQKKPSDTTERSINLVNVPQPFRSEQTEVSTQQNSQNLPLESEVYDNDSRFGVQEKPGVYSNPCLEENKQNIVYASLNHTIIEMNPRQARNMEEAPTEYAVICMRS